MRRSRNRFDRSISERTSEALLRSRVLITFRIKLVTPPAGSSLLGVYFTLASVESILSDKSFGDEVDAFSNHSFTLSTVASSTEVASSISPRMHSACKVVDSMQSLIDAGLI